MEILERVLLALAVFFALVHLTNTILVAGVASGIGANRAKVQMSPLYIALTLSLAYSVVSVL